MCILSTADHDTDTNEISAAFTLGNGPAETLCSHHILPMTRVIPSIRYAAAATAAGHLANRLQNEKLHRRRLHLRLKATELLRAELQDGSDLPDLARLLCMLLLAQLDVCIASSHRRCLSNSCKVCSGDCVEFAIHLKATRTFIRQSDFEDPERGFVEQRLAW